MKTTWDVDDFGKDVEVKLSDDHSTIKGLHHDRVTIFSKAYEEPSVEYAFMVPIRFDGTVLKDALELDLYHHHNTVHLLMQISVDFAD